MKISENALKYSSVMETLRFKEVEYRYDAEAFGNYVYDYKNKNIYVRLLNDRGDEVILVRNKKDFFVWYDIQIIKCFLENIKDSNFLFSFEQQINFLEKNVKTILNLFEDKQYENTKESLEKLLKVRAKQLFPGAFND